MILKKAFLLLELLIALTLLIFIITTFSYFLLVIIQTRDLSVKRLKALNYGINFLEKNELNLSYKEKKFLVQVKPISLTNKKSKIFHVQLVEINGKTSFNKDFSIKFIAPQKEKGCFYAH